MGGKLRRPWSDAAVRRLIWVYIICSGLHVPIVITGMHFIFFVDFIDVYTPANYSETE